MMVSKKAISPAVLYVLLFVGGGVLGYVLCVLQAVHAPVTVNYVREGGYQFINPLISCEVSEDLEYPGFDSLQNTLNSTVQKIKNSGKVTRMSVYFRDLDRGRWTGVNVDDTYIPASLDKLPVLIAWLKETPLVDLPKVLLNVPAGTDQNANETFPPKNPLQLDKTYSVETLLKSMIQQSDNNAAYALYDAVSTSTLSDVFSSFDVGIPDSSDDKVLSVKMYGRFFRILYNASYLGRTKSQTALEMMAGTSFNDGIVKPLPASTPVSHKFGERTITSSNNAVVARELHDCGIVYYPRIPYLICVMTEGSDFSSMESAIQEVSLQAYQAVKGGLIQPEPLEE